MPTSKQWRATIIAAHLPDSATGIRGDGDGEGQPGQEEGDALAEGACVGGV